LRKKTPLHTYPITTFLLISCLVIPVLGLQGSQSISSYGTISYYIFDKWITWADGSKEHVQIGDGFFILNETKRRLVGFVLGLTGVPDPFWSAENLALFDKELAYLESIGVRLISEVNLFFVGADENNQRIRYKAVLDLLYKHKMLFTAMITDRYNPGFDCSINRVITGTYTMGNWTRNWVSIANEYPNLVGILVEDEMDDFQHSNPSYMPEQVRDYMKWLMDLIKSLTDVPVSAKLVHDDWISPETKALLLPLNRGPSSVSCYGPDLTTFNNSLTAWENVLQKNGRPTTDWWAPEHNKMDLSVSPWDVDTPHYTIEYAELVLNHGASLVALFVMNRQQNPSWAFFDGNGDPVDTLLTIAPQISGLQRMQ